MSAPSVTVSDAPSTPAPYGEPSAELRRIAIRFVTAAMAYDAWTEEPRTFLTRVADLATDGELGRLRRSERARLRWWVLRQRLEQVRVHVTGVTEVTGVAQNAAAAGGMVRLEVELVGVTRSAVSTVRDFVDLTLDVVRTPQGWRVDDADGGGL